MELQGVFCQRLLNEVVFKSVLDTIEHVCATTTDGNSRGTATGLLASISTFNFVISLVTVTSILLAINIISETLQSCQIDLLTANKQIHVLKIELQRLRTENVWLDAFSKAENFAIKFGLNTEFSTQRSRRVSCRVDNNPSTGITFSPKDNLRVNFYEALVDSMISEINSRFPNQLINFAFLDPRNFEAIDAEENLLKLVHQYKKISTDRFIAEWKLARHFIKQDTPYLMFITNYLIHAYTELRCMYRILYTLPVTTAHAERSFSKLSLIKTKLRSTMCEDRLESLMFCSIEKDILLSLDNEDLISKFVTMGEIGDYNYLICAVLIRFR